MNRSRTLILHLKKLFLHAVLTNTSHCAVLLATHRLVAMDQFDEILVLDAGRIIQRGKHANLISQAGLYQTLWNQQNNLFFLEP